MNREIKFRAWDKDQKRFIYPKLWDNKMPSNWERWFILSQFTGLKDRNGKEIYEGDVTKGGDVIKWNNKLCLFCRHYLSMGGEWLPATYPMTDSDDLIIIGNLYEHPNLLK
jgi:hypothetical protein